MPASVRDLLLAAQTKKSPFISLLEGVAQGFGRAQMGQQAREAAAFKLDAARAQEERNKLLFKQEQDRLRRLAEEDAKARKKQEILLRRQRENEQAKKLNDASASPGPSIKTPEQKFTENIIFDPKTGFSRTEVVPVKVGSKRPVRSMGEVVARAVDGKTISMKEGFRLLREEIAPRVVKDQFGRPGIVTADGGVKPLGTAGGKELQEKALAKDPRDALNLLRVKAPKKVERFLKIKDAASPATNSRIAHMVDSAAAATRVLAILDSPSQVGKQALGFYFARMAGSNSQLSDREREVFEQPLALKDKALNFASRLARGDLTEKMKNDLRILARVMKDKARIEAQKAINAQKRTAKTELGQFYTPGLDANFPNADNFISTSADTLDSLLQESLGQSGNGKGGVINTGGATINPGGPTINPGGPTINTGGVINTGGATINIMGIRRR